MKTWNTEAVIVGGGPAGLAAALELASAGVQVLIIEKDEQLGGLRKGGIGPFGVESWVQKNAFVDLTCEQAFNYFMEFTHWKTDARLVSEYIRLSG